MRRRFLLAWLLTACAPSLTTIPAGAEFELSPGGTARLDGTGIDLTMIDVKSDSRCPADVMCVWAGDAEVRLRARGGERDTTVSLHTTQEPRTVTVGTVRLELTSLAPPNQAGSPTPPSAYRARIRWSTP